MIVAKGQCPYCHRGDSRFPLDVPVTIVAICPECGQMKSIRQCYTCKRLMCTDCYQEHQGECLRKSKVQPSKGK